MVIRITIGFWILFVFPHVSQCAEVIDLAIESRTAGRIGYTNYELRDTDSSGTVYSLLQFPLNTIYLGASFQLSLESASGREFEILAGTIVNIIDPSAVMKDSDWIQPYAFPKLKFSYTESRAELLAIEITLEGRMRVFADSKRKLFATGGYRYLRYAEDIIGYEGWYLDLVTGQIGDYTPNQNDIAIEYYVNYHTPFIGILWIWSNSPYFSLHFGADLSVAFLNDYDDHRLRGKDMTASGFGVGLSAKAGFSVFPFGQNGKRSPYIKIMAVTNYLSANIEQTQRWYMDEGSTPAGTVIQGINHEIRSLQVGAEFLAGVKLKR